MNPYYHQQQQPQDTNPSCRQMLAQAPQFSQHWGAPHPQQLVGVPPGLNNDLPFIANAVGNLAGQSATVNPAFTYYFNIIAYQNFQNEKFMQLVEFTARYYLLVLEQRMASGPADALEQATTYGLQAMASVTAASTPQLHPFLPPDVMQACINIASKVQSVVAQFNQQNRVQNSGGYLSQQQQPGYGGGYTQAPPNGVMVDSFRPVQPTGGYNSNVQPQVNVADGAARSRRVIVPPRSPQASQESQYFAVPGVHKEPTVKPAPPEPIVEQQKSPATVTHMSQNNGIETIDLGVQNSNKVFDPATAWRSSTNQLYEQAFNSNFQKRVYETVRSADGKTSVQISIVEELGKDEMNRADHTITTAQALYRGMSQTQEPRIEKLASDLDLTARAMDAIAKQEDDELTETYLKMNLMDTENVFKGEDSLTSFVTTLRMRRMMVQNPGERTAFNARGSIVTNFVVDQKLAAKLFTALGQMTTFDGVVYALKDFAQNNKTEAATALVWRVDRYLRRELLHVIRRRMGISSFAFDSFIDDQKEVMEVLEKDWGVAYKKALLGYQAVFIHSLFGAESITYGDDDLPLVSSEPMSTVTLLDIDYDEFGIRIGDNASHQVFETNYPGLLKFIKSVVENNPEALHHYIVTEDDYVYEVQKSITGHEVYLISNGPSLV